MTKEQQSKEAMTLLVEKSVAKRLRDAVRNTDTRSTLSEVAGTAMQRASQLLERWYNNDRQFPLRKTKLKGGRPPKSDDQKPRIERERLTVYVDANIAARFRSAVYYTPTHETISYVITRALNHAALILERKRLVAARKRNGKETL